jgi:hypothetical protein
MGYSWIAEEQTGQGGRTYVRLQLIYRFPRSREKKESREGCKHLLTQAWNSGYRLPKGQGDSKCFVCLSSQACVFIYSPRFLIPKPFWNYDPNP